MRAPVYRWLGIGAVLLALGIICLAFTRSAPSQFPMVVALNDGSAIRILKMEYGTNIYLTNLTVWQKIVLKVPRKLRPSGFIAPPLFSQPRPSVVMVWQDAKTNRSSSLYFELEDENGFKTPYAWNADFRRNSRGMLKALSFYNFPRRSEKFKLRIHFVVVSGRGDIRIRTSLAGEAWFSNDFKLKSAPWPNTRLPAEKSSGGLTVRMLDATWNPYNSQENLFTNLAGRAAMNQSEVELSLLVDNQITTNWGVYTLTMDDASGNHLDPQDRDPGEGRGNGGVFFASHRDSLWPTEPIRYRMEFGKFRNFSSNEIWTISDIPVPSKGTFTAVGLSTNLNGQKIIMEGIAGFQSTVPWQRNQMGIEGSLDFITPGMTNGTRLRVVSMIDDQGRAHQPTDISAYRYGNQEHSFRSGLDFASSKTVTIQVTLQKSVFVEFTVQPRVAK